MLLGKNMTYSPDEFAKYDLTAAVGDSILLENNNIPMSEKFSFLIAPRFVALVIGAVMFYLKTKQIVGEAEMILVNTILAGFITVRTIDRVSDKQVEAASVAGKTTTVTIPSDVQSVTASVEK